MLGMEYFTNKMRVNFINDSTDNIRHPITLAGVWNVTPLITLASNLMLLP